MKKTHSEQLWAEQHGRGATSIIATGNTSKDALNAALEHPLNSPYEVYRELFPEARSGASPKRLNAVHRGGKNTNSVSFERGVMWDFTEDRAYTARQILTELGGLSRRDAALWLLNRAGISGGSPRVLPRRSHPVQPAPKRRQRADEEIAQWQDLSETGSSPYLERKGVDGSACRAIRYDRNHISVLASRISTKGELEPVTIQRIYDNGRKRFIKNVIVRGACVLVGAHTFLEALATRHIYVVEGLATALTVHAATGAPVLCVFMAGNLEPITTALRKLRKKSELAISLAADDDRYKPKTGNAGLEKAHHAALLNGCRVVSPTFADLRGKPTDFNDLQLLEGLEEVARQLATTSLPDPALAHAGGTRRALRAGGGRNIPRFELADGVTFVRSPQGTGKTEALRPLIDRYQQEGKRVLYLTHRTALADDAARRLKLYVYSDEALRKYLHLAPALACCVNSLHRLTDSKGKLQAFDVVILDESEQFVRALGGKHISQKRRNLEALEFVLRRAQKLVCLDANLGDLTETLMAQVRPHEHWRKIEHNYPVGAGRTMQVHSRLDGVYAALHELEGPILCVTNYRTEAENVDAYLTKMGKRGRILTAERDADDAQLMTDLDGKTQDLDYLVCSPAVSTGVSLVSGHFKHVVGIFYSNIGTPEDALQALWRVRTHASYDAWLDPRIVTERIDLDAKHGALRAHETAALGREAGYASTLYDALSRATAHVEQQAQATYRHNFLKLAASQGFGFEMLEDEGVEDLAKQASVLADEQRRKNILEARVLRPDEAIALAAQKLKTKADRYALGRNQIMAFYHLTPDDDLAHVLEVDHRGRYRKQLLRLERSLEDEARTLTTIDELIAEREMAADLPALVSLKELHRETLKAVGFDGAARLISGGKACQLDMPRYDSESLEAFRRWIERNRSWLSGLIALPTPAKLKANIIRYVGSWLKTLGLKQKRTGKNDAQAYALELESLETACRTMEKRGTLSLESLSSKKSVPSTLPLLAQPLETLRVAVQQANDSPTRARLLDSFTLADRGDEGATEALTFYAQKPQVRKFMGLQ